MENETVIYVKERGYVSSIMLLISAFIIIIGTAINWFEVLGIGFDLHDYDDLRQAAGEESGFGAGLVILSIILIILEGRMVVCTLPYTRFSRYLFSLPCNKWSKEKKFIS